ncbi:hypothetical protein [Leptospira levettii]|uniref:hypothetical protein n=1 Tax=Leptospira levettii TaxID=2023178 RepID=UPI0014382E40|nr:hypothetical protein [Leptospira levettii]
MPNSLLCYWLYAPNDDLLSANKTVTVEPKLIHTRITFGVVYNYQIVAENL